MSAHRAIRDGAAAVKRHWRVWALVWAATVGFALVLILPAAAVLHADLGHSLYAARMLDNFNPEWGAEFLLQTGTHPAVAIPPFIGALAAGYLLVMTFLNGGALAVFTGTDTFWTGCGRNFGRLLRLLLLALACYALIFAANFALRKIGDYLWGQGMEERPVVIFGWVRAAAVVVAALFLNMVFDYAKINTVARNARNPFRTALDSFVFVTKNFGPTTGTYAGICAMVIAATAAYWALSRALPWLVLVILFQQAFTALRVALRLLFLASQTELALKLSS
jgi:hypothetical protein